MSKPTTSHPERTVAQPRQNGLHQATICYIRNVNPRVRLLRLALPYAIKFLPGQWLDVHIPSLPNHTGGFTITSTPAEASDSIKQEPLPSQQQNQRLATTPRPYLELAVQNVSRNPPAAWLWSRKDEIMNKHVLVRVGGSFTWPPPVTNIRTAVFIAGGVGINPLISMLSYLAQPEQRDTRPEIVKLLYSTRLAGDGHDQVLFLSRLMRVFGKLNQGKNDSGTIDLHLTDSIEPSDYVSSRSWLKIHNDRLTHQQLESNLGPTSGRKDSVVAYVCGPPAMTDEFVNVLQTQEGMKNRVFCEKWW